MRKLLISPIILLITIAIAGCGILSSAAKLEAYDLGGGDSIPSINSIVGERQVTGVKSSVENGIKTKEYGYASTSVYDDLFAYVTALIEDEGWLVTREIDLEAVPGSGELGKESADDGQILLMTLSYDDSGYELIIVKGNGSIDPNA